MSEGPIVLVVGATGKFARLVVPELRSRGAVVRALVRDRSRAEVARAVGAEQIASGDLRDPASLDRALSGVTGVFHIGPVFAADEAQMGVALVRAAERAGVEKFVFSSVNQPTNIELKHHVAKVPVESALYNSRLRYTILQPANFMQNIGLAWSAIVSKSAFAEPFPCDARIARVDYRDVAEVAAIALTDARLDFATLQLSAGMFDRREIASMISEELGAPIEAQEMAFDEWVAVARPPYGQEELKLLATVFDHYSRYGLGGNSLSLAAALQREPRSMRAYIRECARSGHMPAVRRLQPVEPQM
jgi:uncharacterized protein YbjT (DUF2867 family)